MGILKSNIDGYQQVILLALCATVFLTFILALGVFFRSGRLWKQVNELQRSTQRLINAEEARLLRERRGNSTAKTPE